MTETKELYEKGLRYLKLLGVHPNVLSDYREDKLNFSLEPSGALYCLNDEQKETVNKLEENRDCRVIHLIKGTYGFEDGSRISMETYLLVTGDCPPDPEECEDGGYCLCAYVKGRTSEYGDVVVISNNGGLKRMY